MARATPEERNRYVDALRAVSILVVVLGHWVAAAPFQTEDGTLSFTHLLAAAPWSQRLTWVLQVMPVFFFVGGYSNGISWRSARRRGQTYSDWLDARLRRLMGPALPLVGAWVIFGVVGVRLGMKPEWVQKGSQLALIPVWFLAVYLAIALLVPLTHALWERLGLGSIVALLLPIPLLDFLFFTRPEGSGIPAPCWLNYLFVWSAIHQLGYAWLDDRLKQWMRGCLFVGGIAGVMALTMMGPYPSSMVGVPGEDVSNTTPPKLVIVCLGFAQIGGLLLLEGWARKRLAGERTWAATVLINGMIMTVFLWHMTVLVVLTAGIEAAGGPGLAVVPATGEWWLWKLAWIALWGSVLLVVAGPLGVFERSGRGVPAPAWRQVLGALALSAGLAMMAWGGVAGGGALGVRPHVLAPVVIGALLALPRGRKRARAA